jgi:hypothetical protein
MKIPFSGQKVWGFQGYATPLEVSVIKPLILALTVLVLTVNTCFDCSGADGQYLL